MKKLVKRGNNHCSENIEQAGETAIDNNNITERIKCVEKSPIPAKETRIFSPIETEKVNKCVAKKSKTISFRLTTEQYKSIYAQCVNAHGEELMTIGTLARQALLTQRVVKPVDNVLMRYRLAVAGEIAMSITEIAQAIEPTSSESKNLHLIIECGKIIEKLEQIQERVNVLLTPLNDEDYEYQQEGVQ